MEHGGWIKLGAGRNRIESRSGEGLSGALFQMTDRQWNTGMKLHFHDAPATSRQMMTMLREFAFDPSSRYPIARWAPIPLRLIVGVGFIQHGVAKLSRGPDAFVAILHALGVPAPHLMAWSTILVELLGGLAILLGAFVALASLPMAALLLVAIVTVHLPYGFSSIKLIAVTSAGAQFGPVGYECNLLYLACLAALVLGGPGPLAIDRVITGRM